MYPHLPVGTPLASEAPPSACLPEPRIEVVRGGRPACAASGWLFYENRRRIEQSMKGVHPWTISAPLRPTREVPRRRHVHPPEHRQDQRPDQVVRARANLRGLGLQHRPLDLQPCASLLIARSRRQARVSPVARDSAAPAPHVTERKCSGGASSALAVVRHHPAPQIRAPRKYLPGAGLAGDRLDVQRWHPVTHEAWRKAAATRLPAARCAFVFAAPAAGRGIYSGRAGHSAALTPPPRGDETYTLGVVS